MNNKVYVVKNNCNACGACEKACPAKAIVVTKKKIAAINEKECIRCYCCHEIYPEHAIQLRTGVLYKAGQRIDPLKENSLASRIDGPTIQLRPNSCLPSRFNYTAT